MRYWLACLWLLSCCVPLAAQNRTLAQALAEKPASQAIEVDAAVAAPVSVEGALKQMSDAADVIFVGQVKAIRRVGSVVEIDWEVSEAVRGVSAGVYTQREWTGLWPVDTQRYVVGQHSLVMLHAASAAGLSSPVPDGVIPVQGDAFTGFVDLRWVMTHVARAEMASQGVGSVQGMADLLSHEAGQLKKTLAAAQGTAAHDANSVSQDGSHVDRAVVTGLLRVWGRNAR